MDKDHSTETWEKKEKEEIDFTLDEWKRIDDLEEFKNDLDLQDKALESLAEKIAELTTKVINLANKLDDHLYEPDAHHVAMIAKKKNEGS